jgi:tRNA(Ile)-lysidine synthase
MPAMQPFEIRLADAWPTREWCDTHVVLAVSGGADSVAMLCGLAASKRIHGGSGNLYVAHLNHAIRGAEADADAAWLEQLCEKWNVPIEVGKADVSVIASQRGDGLEAAARDARYTFLIRTAERLGARFVAVAHTADDQVETVLQRVLRGTGLAGLAGIPRIRALSPSVALVRPMLSITRSEALEYLAAIGQAYRTDASNADSRFTRNRLRCELLPLLRESYNVDVHAALLRLANQAGEAQRIIAERAAEIARDCVTVEFAADTMGARRVATLVRIDCRLLATEPMLIIREVCKSAWDEANWPLQAMGYNEWQQLAEMVGIGAKLPAINLPGAIQACRDGHLLLATIRLP